MNRSDVIENVGIKIFLKYDVYLQKHCPSYRHSVYEKIERNKESPKESPTRQHSKCCRLGLIEPVHG
jgi:hypothetical protein